MASYVTTIDSTSDELSQSDGLLIDPVWKHVNLSTNILRLKEIAKVSQTFACTAIGIAKILPSQFQN